MSITTHVLDTALGRPASGIEVHLERQTRDGTWTAVGSARTDADGRVRSLMPPASEAIAGTYRLTFETAPYFKRRSIQGFYPRVVVEFVVRESGEHHHVPLLISPFGYSTYRGS